MSLHKLTAGSGYDYLTRQVAAMDATDKGHTGLASYYTEKGETPGVWVGSGMEGIEGLDAGDVVTADHMQSLFGSGHHPLATAADQGAGPADRPRRRRAARPRRTTRPPSGSAPRTRSTTNDVSPFRIEVAKRLAAVNEAAGLPGDWPVPAAERARIRTEVGRGVLPRRARPRAGRRPRARRHDRQALPPEDQRGRRLRPDLLPGQERLGAVGDRRPEDRRGDRAGPPGGDQGRAGLHRDQGAVHPRGHQRRPPGRRPRPGRHRVHPPRLPRRRPRPAHPRRGREQGPDPRRQVAGDRRPAAATRPSRLGLGDLQHRARAAPGRRPRRAVRGAPERGRPQAAGARDRRRRPRAEPRFSKRRAQRRGPPQGPRRGVPGHPRPPADAGRDAPAGPAGHPGDPRGQARAAHRWPSSARPGTARRSRSSAPRSGSSR